MHKSASGTAVYRATAASYPVASALDSSTNYFFISPDSCRHLESDKDGKFHDGHKVEGNLPFFFVIWIVCRILFRFLKIALSKHISRTGAARITVHQSALESSLAMYQHGITNSICMRVDPIFKSSQK